MTAPILTYPLRPSGYTRATRDARVLALALAVMLAVGRGAAQEEFFHPELDWKSIETEHFFVHYHEGAGRTARVVAKIAEEIYEPVTSFYDHRPDSKVSLIIRDVDDVSNGAAYFYENRIEILAPSMDFEFRGTHNWLRNVVTHEFTHVVQIQTAMKFGRTVPGAYLQWLNYESERRPDVLYGYPNVIVSYPYSGFVVPVWFAEGVAQYNRPELRYDFWDTHRDMILRSYALDSTMLSWEEMGVFGKTSLGNESAYNAGFAFVTYLARTYGEEKIAEISRNLSSFGAASIDVAIEKATGKPGREVYAEWRAALEREYAARTEPVRRALREGERLITEERGEVVNPRQIQAPEGFHRPRAGQTPPATFQPPCCRAVTGTGFANLYPAFSPDGTKIAYTSTKGGDYFSLSALYVYDTATGEEKMVQAGVRTPPAWSPDGRSLYYSKLTRNNPHWSLQFDVYRHDLEEDDETRITSGRRAQSPSISPDGASVVFVTGADGTTNLAAVDRDGGNYRQLTAFTEGVQVYNPRWSPAGDMIVFDYSVHSGRDVAAIAPDGTGFRFLVQGDDDSRCAALSADGSRLVFSSDRTGIYNIYALNLKGGIPDQLTNVTGGAFYPSISASGDIVYALYTSQGYKLRLLRDPSPVPDSAVHAVPAGVAPPFAEASGMEAAANTSPGHATARWDALRSYDDTVTPDVESKPYRAKFTGLNVVPFIRIDNYNPTFTGLELIKLGAYVFSSDVLDKTGIFAGASLNAKLERDLFLQFLYRGRIPLLYQLGLEPVASLELYNVSRKGYDVAIALGADTVVTGSSYNLLEFDLALNQRFVSQFSSVEFRYAHSRYTSILDGFTLPATNELVASSSDLYLIGNDLSLLFRLDAIVPSRTSEINPMGRRVTLRIGQEFNKLGATDSAGYSKYELTSSGVRRVYDIYSYQRLELAWREYLPLFFRNHTLTLGLRAGAILGPPVDEFFDFYAGGLVGMRGYSYYSISGNEMLSLGMAYRFPLMENIDSRVLWLQLARLYGMVYADAGDAWTGAHPEPKNFKTDAGLQLRLETFSFYTYPTRIFLDAAYGFTRFDRYVRNLRQVVTYGREWRFYFGILFGFDFD